MNLRNKVATGIMAVGAAGIIGGGIVDYMSDSYSPERSLFALGAGIVIATGMILRKKDEENEVVYINGLPAKLEYNDVEGISHANHDGKVYTKLDGNWKGTSFFHENVKIINENGYWVH